MGYFAYVKKRSGADLFEQIGGQTDMGRLLPQYIRDFWWVLLIYILLIVLLAWMYRRVKLQRPEDVTPVAIKSKVAIALSFVLITGLVVLGIRGGLQRLPMDIVDAGGMTTAEEVPIVLNTPFTLIKSLDKKSLAEYSFYSEAEIKKIFNPIHKFGSEGMNRKNVVVVLLESFAKEYTSLGGTVSYTPFLDSLMHHSLVFTNAYANGAKSIEGIPAILSSLPSLNENPFINSAYYNNRQTSFATLLQPEGYTTAFFHGGTNGTMNFDIYAKLAGYGSYFGRNEYNNDTDFDGFWGIWDEPFLQYSVKKMSTFKQPFHSAIFTLSSHHPYKIPKQYEGKFPKGHLENSESIGYADYALRQFFESAKKTSWYHNTLFVLCADHASLSDHPYFRHIVGLKSIPVVFFEPDDGIAGYYAGSFSQIDILPSVMNLLGYNKPFFSFGQSYIGRNSTNCFFYQDGTNFMVRDTLFCGFQGAELSLVNNIKTDSLLEKNVLGKYPAAEAHLNEQFRAFIQTYNHVLITNSGVVK